jgi:hypothetical protein
MQATYEPVAIVLIALQECRLTYSKQRQLSGACPQSEEEPVNRGQALKRLGRQSSIKVQGDRSVAKLPIAVYVEDEHTRSTLMARDRSKAIP